MLFYAFSQGIKMVAIRLLLGQTAAKINCLWGSFDGKELASSLLKCILPLLITVKTLNRGSNSGFISQMAPGLDFP